MFTKPRKRPSLQSTQADSPEKVYAICIGWYKLTDYNLACL
jgi:hypothetical protein